jgi:hypothetical protein
MARPIRPVKRDEDPLIMADPLDQYKGRSVLYAPGFGGQYG